MASVGKLAVRIDADQERAEIFPTGAGLREAPNDHFLLQVGLDLEPGGAPHSRLVGTVTEFGDDSFEAFLLRRFEEGVALTEDVVGVLHNARNAHDVAEQALAVL